MAEKVAIMQAKRNVCSNHIPRGGRLLPIGGRTFPPPVPARSAKNGQQSTSACGKAVTGRSLSPRVGLGLDLVRERGRGLDDGLVVHRVVVHRVVLELDLGGVDRRLELLGR